MRPEPMVWTLKKIAILRAGYGKKSATLLANEIGCGRNAVVGKAFRLGLAKNKTPGWMPTLRAPRAHRAREVTVPKSKPTAPIPPQVIPDDIWQPFPGTMPVPLLQLKSDHCRWPVTGGFCGCPIHSGSYCAAHFRIACSPPRASIALPPSGTAIF